MDDAALDHQKSRCLRYKIGDRRQRQTSSASCLQALLIFGIENLTQSRGRRPIQQPAGWCGTTLTDPNLEVATQTKQQWRAVAKMEET